MITRIDWEDLNRDGERVLEALAAGRALEVAKDDEIIAVLSPPSARGMASLKVRKARRRGGFEEIVGVRPSRPTAELLNRLRGPS